MSKPVMITTSMSVGVIGLWQKNSLKHQTRNSRWFSKDFHSYQEGKATMTEHQLFQWPHMWIDGLSPFCCTKIPSLRGDLTRHEGCRPKSLNLCLVSRMGSYWLRKKSSLSDSHENEAQGKRNLEVKNAAEGYLTPKEPNEGRITKKGHLIPVVRIIHSKNSAKVEVLPSDQRWPHRGSRILPYRASKVED
jgi:hypothetical protein